MISEQDLRGVCDIHSKLSELFNGNWGIDWTYYIEKIEEREIKLTLKYQIKGKSMQIETFGDSISNALEVAYYLLSKSFEDNTKRNTPESTVFRETYTPTAYDMEQMADYFTKYPALYKQCFAKQINQSQPAFGMLTEEQRIRLCILWKQYMQTIHNE